MTDKITSEKFEKWWTVSACYNEIDTLRDKYSNENDIEKLGFSDGDKVDITSMWNDGKKRQVKQFMLVAYDIPPGQAAAYYPETNPLVPLESYGDGTFTPTSKFIAIKLSKSEPDNRIEVSAV